MKRSLPAAFTLIEMLMVMLIIAVIASLIVAVAGPSSKKSTAAKAYAEIQALGTACESYKVENGTYPRSATYTEQNSPTAAPPIDPRADGDPNAQKYKDASLFLYEQLSGDFLATGHPPAGARTYHPFKPAMLNGLSQSVAGGGTPKVNYIQDPYGLSYGYSTAGDRAEEDYRAAAATDQKAVRSSTPVGYNSTFDLWSTGGLTTTTGTTLDDKVRARWQKNF